MSDCLGCNAVEGPAHVLHSGSKVCSTCPEWMLECEAREILRLAYREGRMRAEARLAELADHRVARGRVEELRARMNAIRSTIKPGSRPHWVDTATGGTT